jgi:hypothetical protein
MLGVALKGLCHLESELTRRREDKHLRLGTAEVDPSQQRKREGGSLTGTGLGLAQQISSGKQLGSTLLLNRGGDFVAQVLDRLKNGRGKVDPVEAGVRIGGIHGGLEVALFRPVEPKLAGERQTDKVNLNCGPVPRARFQSGW